MQTVDISEINLNHGCHQLMDYPLSCLFQSYQSKCGHTMAMFSDEPIETCNGRLRFMERRHNLRCRNLVGTYKSQRSKSSFDMWNIKNSNLIEKKMKKKRGCRYW